ncbi:MAG: glycosyltransferase family 9 protein [Firmicutes bacterium]|nr:glycosyltransferase family 9 protein [Bacillota bacterium]
MAAICFGPLGDTLFTTPAIRALRFNLPQAYIVVLVNQLGLEVYRNNPHRIEIIGCLDQWDLLKKTVEIRKCGFDLVLGLSQIGSFFTRFCGAPVRSDFFTIAENKSNLSVVKLCLEVITEVGLAVNTYETEFWHGKQEERIVEHFLKKAAVDLGKPMVAIHCGGRYFIRKRWPLLKFSALIKILLEETRYQVVLIGGKEDREDSEAIASVLPGVINAAGGFSLGETAALLKRCQLLIANDSGPLHLGAAVGVPTIGLFGPTTPEQFFPYRPPRHRYIYKKLSCSPCYRFGGGLWQYLPRCSKAYCMEAIEVEEVLELILNGSVAGRNSLVEVT